MSDCLRHLQDKHGGSQYVAVENLGKFFTPWTVSRDIWLTALRPDVSGIGVDVRLFHEAGCRLVHKYRMYKDPFSHSALRGHWSSRRIRSRWTVRIFRYMTQFALIFRRSATWISLLRSRMCLSPFSNPHRGFCIFHGRGRSGGRTVIRLCLTFRRSSPAGFLGDIGDSRLIRRHCRFRQLFMIAWTTRLLPMWALPGMSQILRPRLLTSQRLLWRLCHLGWISCQTSCLTRHAGRRSPGFVPRWRLARDGPLLAKRSSSSLRCFGDGCSFRNTTYRPSDYASLSGEFGVPLHHPRFLEWIGVPESASLLEMGPGRWLRSLSRDQAMDVAIQLHWDVCLMTTNLDVLDRYALCLQGTASEILELGLGPQGFPSAEVYAGALGPRVRCASVQMEAMGLWQPSLDPVMIP